MIDRHLAQLNLARLRAPLADPSMREFAEALDRINLLAERSPGFRLAHDGTVGARVEL